MSSPVTGEKTIAAEFERFKSTGLQTKLEGDADDWNAHKDPPTEHLADGNNPKFAPARVKYCPPFSDNIDGEKEEITGIRMDCKENDSE
jgi:hypothetical protein